MADGQTPDHPFPKDQPFVAAGVLYQHDAYIAQWIANRMNFPLVEVPCVGFGVMAQGVVPDGPVSKQDFPKLAAAALFWSHQDDKITGMSDIYVTVWADEIVASHPRIISTILAFPFGQLKVRRISAEIDAANDRCIRQCEVLGFQHEGTKRRMAPGGGDMLLLGLIPEDCPFWPPGKPLDPVQQKRIADILSRKAA